MKKITIFFLLCGYMAQGQFTTGSAGGSPTVKSTFQGAVSGKKGLVNIFFPDTTAANADPNLPKEPGLMIMTANNYFHVRSSDASKWVLVNGIGGPGSDVPDSMTQVGSVYCYHKGGSPPTCWDLGKFIDSLPLNWNGTYILHYNKGRKLPDSTQLIYTIGHASGRITITNNVPSPGHVTIGFDSSGLFTSTSYIVKEAPAGAINGSNVTFTLAAIPVPRKEMVFLNGILQDSDDYSISGAVITYLRAPPTGAKILVTYIK